MQGFTVTCNICKSEMHIEGYGRDFESENIEITPQLGYFDSDRCINIVQCKCGNKSSEEEES